MEELQRRGPGRPPKYVEAESDEPIQKKSARKPFGAMQQKLAYDIPDGYHGHWFNDTPGRVSTATEAGYAHVKDKETGKNVVRVVGTAEGGGPLHGYLMMIIQEWYDEDMAAQQKERNEKMAAIKRGDADRQDGDGRYIPKQGITIKDGR